MFGYSVGGSVSRDCLSSYEKVDEYSYKLLKWYYLDEHSLSWIAERVYKDYCKRYSESRISLDIKSAVEEIQLLASKKCYNS